tara:strand:- start:21688 stop:22740 length:1053 start_codon:yes stop_codon:yes gene_type:complete
MKRVIVIINDISKGGGTERVASFVANLLSEHNINVTLLSLSNNHPSYYELSPMVSLQYFLGKSKFSLARYLQKNKFDLIIPISMGRLSVEITFLCKIFGISAHLILSEHVAFERFSKPVQWLKLLAYKWSDETILLTEHDFYLLTKKVNANFTLIPNASQFPILKNIEMKANEPIVLAVGRLTYQKGLDRLLNIWSKIEEKNGWKLKIIGDGEEKESLANLISQLSISDSVSIFPSTKNIANEFLHAGLVAMTSRYEGLPLVLIEAKSFATPCVSYDCKTGPREIINNGVDGLLIAEGKESDYVQVLSTLISNKSFLSRLQKGALINAQLFSSPIIGKQWIELMRKYKCL